VLDTESWKAHLRGKKHLKALQLEEQRRNAEEQRRNAEQKGIYVRGLFCFVFSVCYIQATFGYNGVMGLITSAYCSHYL
jgi:hypothetical protein